MTITEEELPRKLPHVIAHRGYSGKYPENTIISYEKAVETGTTALEGDIRISKDGELVMMHDLTLQRTTSGSGAVHEQDWKYIAGLRTKTTPPQPIPRLNDVFDMLRSFVTTDHPDLYMIVDIKFDNDIAILDVLKTLLDREDYAMLKNHIVIGIWNKEFLIRAKTLFPGYRLCFIGISLAAARKHFLDSVDYLSLPFAALYDEEGQQFIAEAQALKKGVFCWTVNAVDQMHTCVTWGIDGVVGDDITTLLRHVRHEPKEMTNEQFKLYLQSSDHLRSRSRRLQYYMLKKGMYLASRAVIGV